MRQKHLKYIKKFGLHEIAKFFDYCSHQETIQHLLESDLLWLMNFDTVRSSGKTYEYFGALKPVLICSPEGIIRKTVLESKAAIATEPKDVRAIEKAIKTFLYMWRTNSLPKPSEEFIQQFNRKELTAVLARELALASEI